MLDFLRIALKEPTKEGKPVEVRPDFTVGRSKDLMIRGGSFYAIWDEELGLWSTDEYDVQRLVDREIQEYCDKLIANGTPATPKFLSSFGTNGWSQFRKFMKNVSDNSTQLDMKLTFANTEVKKSDYASRRLPYSLAPGECNAWCELVSRLYTPEEREKIEWSIGAIISGDAKKIEKFMVFYGQGGTGKSTILKIIEKLFDGYIAMFEAKALVGNNNSFATEAFKDNPLVAIQHDGDLSKIEDNSKLNSVVGHDMMRINEKYKSGYEQRLNAFLYMGTNKAVKITDAKSGLIRRLIDVVPTGDVFDPDHYYSLMNRIDFELGAIAHHCLEVYKSLGKNKYAHYRPERMLLETNVFHNFVDEYYEMFKEQDGISLRQAYTLYKEWVTDTGVEFKLPQYKFRTALRDFFDEFHDRYNVDGTIVRSYYKGFSAKQFKTPVVPETTPKTYKLVLEETTSLLDEMYAGMPAQYGKHNETPAKYWTDEERVIDGELRKPDPSAVCSTALGDLDTSKLHFLKMPSHHIVIDFDLTKDGKKSLEANLEAAAEGWPSTYAEVSKSGKGVHLHYIYDGDPEELAREYSKGIEIKVFTGNASLRRKFSFCNNVPIATISSGLPFREKKPVLEEKTLKDEQHLRNMISKALKKGFEGLSSTKPNVDFIKKLTDDAYAAGFPYDVSDMRKDIVVFATGSTNQALNCLKVIKTIKWASEKSSEETVAPKMDAIDAPVVIFDVECFPNFFGICWMYEDSDTVVRMVNPSPDEVAALFKFKLVGFNNRKYDNHMLYAASMGWSQERLYELSSKLVSKEAQSAYLREAFNLSYADIYEFAATKMGLKKWQIKLGLPHVELDIPFDQPVPPELWDKVMDYCSNDVHSTREVFRHLKQDFVARQILADLSGLPVNATTQKHTSRIIFKGDRNPQKSFIYTDLSDEFPGYVYDFGKSTYCDEEVGEGGYVYAEPGYYKDVVVLDVASMHPTSIIQLEAFGKYTRNFKDLVDARLAIKHGDYESARTMLDGKLAPYLQNEADAERLAYAMKIVINIVYGLTAAKFENDFRDIRNKDNYIAKRGALFMVDLKKFVQSLGLQVVHIKTDSIKIPGASPEDIRAVVEFGKKYGYDFEHEATYSKFCLVNDAVYIAKYGWAEKEKKIGTWDAVGAQFQHPWVFKNLFSGEAVKFDDLCETKSVLSPWVMYLDMHPELATPTDPYAGLVHVGRTGSFVPVEQGGGDLVKVKDNQGKPYAVTGTKGYKWTESEQLKAQITIDMPFFDLEVLAGTVDMSYFDELVKDAKDTIGKYTTYEELVRA